MSHNQTQPWLVVYDISDPKRLARVFKTLKKAGTPVQYSVFAVDATAMGMGTLMAAIAKLIDAREDDVRAYRLPANGWRAELGKTILPDGTWLV